MFDEECQKHKEELEKKDEEIRSLRNGNVSLNTASEDKQVVVKPSVEKEITPELEKKEEIKEEKKDEVIEPEKEVTEEPKKEEVIEPEEVTEPDDGESPTNDNVEETVQKEEKEKEPEINAVDKKEEDEDELFV